MNIQSTLFRTVPDFYKYATDTVLFGSNSNSYTIFTHSDIYIYIYIYIYIRHNMEKLVGQKKLKKKIGKR